MRGTFAFFLAGIVGMAACGTGGGVDVVTSGATTGAGASGAAGGSGGSGGAGGDATGGGGSGGVPGAWCAPIPACDAPPPPPGEPIDWNSIIPPFGDPNHRGRDLFLNPGDPQWILAKFSYGTFDDDIKGEYVDVYVLRDCGDTWEHLGTATTTEDGEHATVEGVEDTGGRVYFQIPPEKALGLGRHRVHLVVKGDLSTTDLFVEVVPKGTPVFVSDIDGTLTTYETEEFVALAQGALPEVRKDAAKLFDVLVSKGYHPFYMTARPEWLGARTRAFLDQNGFPHGIVHTTLTKSGALGSEASSYKTGELLMLAQKGMIPTYAFGNTDTDAEAYFNAMVQPDERRVFIEFDDTVHGGRRIESYTELLDEAEALPSLCP
ncbi:phosphatidylinositol transfer protein [Polyangium sp. y55x31]|uniref:LNS2 domain-containing protein n=1 Tax=Polyangium sp. y55x31 TaxID=3042688 RepID=UPI0024824F79|nr:phosphatidylinositol transfer protein [Polyangium sp. y55x31]MDI1483152.1 phosphatidylinositol transfer protein [Polyangium sp. y55x31]